MEYNKFEYDELDKFGALLLAVYYELDIASAFTRRLKRIKMLKSIEVLTETMLARLKYEEDIAAGNKVTEKITIGKKEVDLRDVEIDGVEDIARVIVENIHQMNMNKKEFKRWETQTKKLIEIADKVAVNFENKGKAKEQL